MDLQTTTSWVNNAENPKLATYISKLFLMGLLV